VLRYYLEASQRLELQHHQSAGMMKAGMKEFT